MDTFSSRIQAVRVLWERLWRKEETTAVEGTVKLAMRIGIIIAFYLVLDKLLMRLSNLPLQSYEESVIYLGFLKQLFSSWYIFPLLLVFALAFLFRRQLWCRWTSFDHGKGLRLLIITTSGILAWSFATYDYNLYFDQGHYVDRLLILLFIPLIFWRPVFVFPFLTLILPVIWQFSILAGFSWAAPFLLLRLLVLFVSCYSLYLLTKSFPVSDFVLVAGSLFAAHYFLSGWGKFSWEWIQYDRLFLILPSTYANGWLKFLDPDTMLSLVQALSPINGVMKVMVLILEIGSVFFFFHRKLPRLFLGGWIMFHIGILLFSGISFWMWILIDACFLILFLRKDAFFHLPVFTKAHFLISAGLIIGGSYWCKPVELAWYDLPFSYSYRVEALSVNDEVVALPPSFFTPYEYQFIMSGLAYLTSHPMLYVQDVKGDADFARQLLAVQSKGQFFELEKSNGLSSFDVDSAEAFDDFVRRYVSNWNKRQSKQTFLSFIRAPGLLWNYPQKLPEADPVQIKQIHIFQVTALFSKEEYAEIRQIPVRTITID